MRRFGFHIPIWRRIDSIAREITTRRNPNMVSFVVAVIAGLPGWRGWGRVAVTVRTALRLGFNGLRPAQAPAAPAASGSWIQG